MPNSKKNHSVYVLSAQCLERVEMIRGDIQGVRDEVREAQKENKRIVEVLVGPDMSSGLVGEIQDIKTTLKTQNTAWNFLKPVIVSLLTALITAIAIGVL